MQERGQGVLAFALVLIAAAIVLAVLWPVLENSIGVLAQGLPLP